MTKEQRESTLARDCDKCKKYTPVQYYRDGLCLHCWFNRDMPLFE